jgi:hypothetical protein
MKFFTFASLLVVGGVAQESFNLQSAMYVLKFKTYVLNLHWRCYPGLSSTKLRRRSPSQLNWWFMFLHAWDMLLRSAHNKWCWLWNSPQPPVCCIVQVQPGSRKHTILVRSATNRFASLPCFYQPSYCYRRECIHWHWGCANNSWYVKLAEFAVDFFSDLHTGYVTPGSGRATSAPPNPGNGNAAATSSKGGAAPAPTWGAMEVVGLSGAVGILGLALGLWRLSPPSHRPVESQRIRIVMDHVYENGFECMTG